ncbi:uncharacterized protein [Nicotiana tomentosiformis]|uniref:uncharacterized protein n=1 Tax=Nicotiana tomentosiformis TaxID=4098 RepID=UPI00388C448A
MIEIVHKDGEPKNSSKSVVMIRASESNPVKAPDSTKPMPLTVEGVSEKLSTLNVKPSVLVMKGPPIDVEANQEKQKVIVPGVPGKLVIIVEGARITPVIIKPVTQLPMVDIKVVPWNYKQVIVTYKGKEVEEEVNEIRGLTRSGRCFTPEELRKAKPFKDGHIPVKKPVTEEEVEEFLKKMKMQDYSIVEQLRKTPAQISLLSLLIHSDKHRKVLMKILNEAHIPDKIMANHLEKIANKIFEANKITFSDDELPMEVEDDKGLWVYQTFETVSVEKIPEGECIPGPKLPSASVMVANEMLKNGFVSGKGLGSSLQGIAHPVCPRESFGTFGLGFTLTGKDMKNAKNLKRKAWSLPKPVPHISTSFVKPGVAKCPILTVPKLVVDFDEELIKRFQSLFDEVNMVEIGEDSSNADVQLVGPNVKLNNWKATPLPTRKEFCSFDADFNDMTYMRNFQPNLKSQSNSEITIKEVECDDETEYDEEAAFQEISGELNHFEVEYKDVFAWSYDDMPGLSTDLVVHKFPTDPAFPPVKQNLRKFKTDISVKIKEEITKQLDAKVIRVTRYPTWLANVVTVPKKDGKTGVCVDYRDLNKPSPKDNFPLPNIHILIDNYTKHEIGSFVDCYAGYHQILMDEEDLLKKNVAVKWTDECQEAFDKIKSYLSNPPMLVQPEPGRHLILYLTEDWQSGRFYSQSLTSSM